MAVTTIPSAGITNATIATADIADGAVSNTKLENSSITLNGSAVSLGGSATIGGGKIGQVIQTVKTDVFSTTSSSLVDVTGLTATITPSATDSKVLVTLNLNIGASDNNTTALFRDSTQIALGDASGSRSRSFTSSAYINVTVQMPSNTTFLDSPNTTSATTYKIQTGAVGGGTTYFGRGATDGDNAQHARTINVITLMEVLA